MADYYITYFNQQHPLVKGNPKPFVPAFCKYTYNTGTQEIEEILDITTYLVFGQIQQDGSILYFVPNDIEPVAKSIPCMFPVSPFNGVN